MYAPPVALGVDSSVAALLAPRRAERAEERPVVDPRLAYHHWAAHAMLDGGCLFAVALLPGWLKPGIVVLLVLWALNGAGQALIAVPSVGLLAAHADASERGRAYAAHFALISRRQW